MKEMEYKPLTLPTVSWDAKKSTASYGELVAQPLEQGFGITLGNALRRVLLSSVEGSAVTSVIIKGTNNEFSSLPGVIEDVLQVVLNIKGLVIKNTTGRAGKMHLSCKGERTITGADITTDAHLQIINTQHVIAHTARDGMLEIEFFVESGRGYRPAQWPEGESLQSDGRIFVDAAFSPVRRVEYHVEKTRVGKSIDYDKLTLSVTTNGTVTPQNVVHYATSVLRTQLEHFMTLAEVPFNQLSQPQPAVQNGFVAGVEVDSKNPTRGLPVELFLKPIEELEFSVRAHNCLINAGVRRVIDLVNMVEDDVLKIKNFGRKSLREVKEILKAFGLHLGMNVKELDLKKMIKDQEDGL